MFPISDENPTRLTPYVTYGLIIVNILCFLYELSLPPEQLEQFFRMAAVVPEELTVSLQGQPPSYGIPEWATLITSQFLHGGWLHLFGNMLYLWIFGNNVEDQMGHIKYLIFYLLCGALAGLTQWYFDPTSQIPSLGASGAIAGVMGAYIIRFPFSRILTLISIFPIRVPAFLFLGIWFVQQAFYGVASLNAPTNIGMQGGGIAYWAHAGGFVFGAILGPLFGLFSNPASPNNRYFR
ncbi:MAG: rhomboid family intramembrane serine protease [Cyanobacteria bacterium CRU_2_1]|nr:rhomboid family intramembrane serine protease [Cyanobacteria bacterium RU_5_0]NJR57706.1 rhomboid family intramembrane serine protease [Cyanobacteria bacterium CRU_2_1]